jgi:hypothetical protein
MDSEWFDAKERLAVERRAQPPVKALAGDSAAWTHMRQRLATAERAARSARRLSLVLSGVSLAALAGVMAVTLPWSRALGSSRSAATAPVRPGATPEPLHVGRAASVSAAEGSTVPRQVGLPPGSGLSSGLSSGDRSPGLVNPGSPPSGPAESAPGSADSHGTQPENGAAPVQPSGKVQEGHASGSGPHPAPKPVLASRPASPHRGRGTESGYRSSGRSHPSVSEWPRASWQRRRLSRYRGRSRHWRFVRVTRSGKTAYCLIDPSGHRWEVRRLQPRSPRRGGNRK